jgi:hypothetical protein
MTSTFIVQVFTAVASIIALVLLFMILNKTKKNFFILSMLWTFIFLMASRLGFTLVYFVDYIDGIIENTILLNWLASFVGLQSVLSVVWIAFLALKKLSE